MYTGSDTDVYTLIQILQNKVLKPELILPTLKLTYLSPSQDLDSLSEWYQGVCVHMSGWKASGTDVAQVFKRRVNLGRCEEFSAHSTVELEEEMDRMKVNNLKYRPTAYGRSDLAYSASCQRYNIYIIYNSGTTASFSMMSLLSCVGYYFVISL